MTGKVANVIVAGDDKDDDDGDEFLVEEKPKDNLDLLTEAPSAPTEVCQTRCIEPIDDPVHFLRPKY